MNVIIARNKDDRPTVVVFIVPDNVSCDAVRAKIRQEHGEKSVREWDLKLITGDLVEVCQSPVAVAKALR